MRLTNIDTQLMRSFITINDAGGFARAAEILHMTQPAISQQMRRLEELIGQPLFERHGRSMLLNMQGETLLGYARQIVALNDEAISRLSDVKRERETVILGMPEHFSDTALHLIIAEAAHQLPDIRLVVKSGMSQSLIDGLEQGKIDLALTLSETGGGQGQVLSQIPIAWISGDGYQFDNTEPVPLVLFNSQCIFRRLVIKALESASRPWRIVYESDDLAGLRAAVRANLGITALPAQQLARDMHMLTSAHLLPALPSSDLSLRFRPAWISAAAQKLGVLIGNVWNMHPPLAVHQTERLV